MRLEISNKTDLAIQAIEWLFNGDGGLVSGGDLAEGIGTSTHRVTQVMQPLLKKYWVESAPGPGGGYRLVVDPTRVSLLDVIEAVEGPVLEDRCVLRGAPCPPKDQCAIHVPWNRARQALLSELEATPVIDGSRTRGTGG